MRFRHTLLRPALACFVIVFCTTAFSILHAAPGELDTIFNGTGKATTPIGSSNDFGQSVAVQADGKIVVAGRSYNGSDFDFALVRYNANGTLDTSLNGTGKVTAPIGASNDEGYSVAVQADGKIVVAGRSDNGSDYDFALVRYNANGTLDTSFNGTGKATTPIGSGNDYGSSVAMQADGKIVVAGRSYNGSDSDFALVRYNANGTLDTSFNGTGKATTSIGSGNDYGLSVAVQADGKIVVAGYSSNGSDTDLALVRYNANGTLDTSLNGTGKVTTPIGASNDEGYSVAVQADGKIVVAGRSYNGSNSDFALVRYNANGTLDTTFNRTGKATTPIGSGDDIGLSVAVQADGKIVVAGYSSNGSNTDFALARYNADGTLDTSFNGTGKAITPIGSGNDFGYSVAVQADGKIVVVGYAEVNGFNLDFALIRYDGAGPIVATGTASDATPTGATLNGTVNPNGASTTVAFEYGRTNSYGSVAIATSSPIAGTSDTAVSAAVGGLDPGTTYYFRVKAVSSAGTSYGADTTFTTPLDASAPVFSGVPGNMTVNVPANDATAVVSWAEPTASDNVGVTSVTSTHSPGTFFPVGATTVTYTATDAAGNTATARFTVTVIDTTLPTIAQPAGGFSPVTLKTAVGAGGVVSLPDYRSQAVTYDAVGISKVSQSPAPGTALRAGGHEVILTVTDTSGNSDSLSLMVTVETGDPAFDQLFTKGVAVPGAGIPGSGIPAATWKSFETPAINGAGALAFIATLQLSPSGTLTGIFAGSPQSPVLLVKKGDSAPGVNEAVFVSFKDPLFNEAGRVAFVANISGAGVTVANNCGIWTNALGTDATDFQLVARKGGSLPGVDRARWKNFSSVALASGELNLVGRMASGAGGVSSASDLVLCRYASGVPGGELLLREGQSLNMNIDGETGKLKSFAALATVSGSPGQRRQPLEGGLHVKATLSDGRTFLLNNIGSAGLNQLEAITGDPVVDQNSQPVGTLTSLGFAADASGSAWGSVFKAALKGAGTSATDNAALVGASADRLSILVRKGEEADAVRAPGALIKAFVSEPVASEKGYASMVTLSGNGVSKPRDTALFWRGNGFSGLLAREGDPAPGAGGALYGSFVSLALTDGAAGPIFVAKLLSAKTGPAGRVTARNDLGLWAADTSGSVRLLLREGDLLDGKTIASFVALPVVLGSAAQARSYNDAGAIAVKVTFSDGSQSIVRLGVP